MADPLPFDSGSGGMNLGTAYAKIVLDSSGVAAGVGVAKSEISKLSTVGDSFQKTGQQLTGVGVAITTLSAPLAAFALTGVKTASDFDATLKQIQLFGKLSPAELEKVRAATIKWGKDTKFTSQDSAEAMLGLLKSGQSVEEALTSMGAVLDLAGAGDITLAESSGIVTSALAIYGLEADEAGRVSNALAQAASASNADVSGLGQALVEGGAVAGRYGLSIEDTAATLAVFADRGIKGADAGTQLKSMLLNLNNSTGTANGALEALGISLSNADGTMRPLNEVTLELKEALRKLPEYQANQFIRELGGSYGITGLSALLATGGTESMRGEMEKAPDAASQAATFMDTFAGSVESLQGSVDTLRTEGLTPLMNDTLKPLVTDLTTTINKVTDWTTKNPELTKVIFGASLGIAGMGIATVVLGQVISATGVIITFFTTTTLGALLLSVFVVTAAVVALIALLNQVQTLQNQVTTASQSSSAPTVNAIRAGLTREQYMERAFNASVAELGDAGARLLWANGGQRLFEESWNRDYALYQQGLGQTATGGGRAEGGNVYAGVPYTVGERGAETFVPNVGGQVMAAGAGGGGWTIQNVNINANTEAGGRAAARGFKEELEDLWRGRGNT